MRRNTLAAACAAAALVVLTACGGGAGDDARPSAEDISKALRNTGDNSVLGDSGIKLDQKSADCMGEALHDSDISDKALRAIVDGEKDYEAGKDDEAAATKVLPEMQKCMGAPTP